MSRMLVRVSDVGPLLLGPLPSDALERLKKWPKPLGLVTQETDLPSKWTLEQKGTCVVVIRLIEAYLNNKHTLDGLLPGFQLVFAFSKSGVVNADARGIPNELGTPKVDLATKPAYLIRIDLDLVELIEQMTVDTISNFTAADLATLLSTTAPINRQHLRWHIMWMTVLLVFLHELGHVLRGHLSAARVAFAQKIPAGANLDLIDELDADVFSNSALAAIMSGLHNMRQDGAPPNEYKFIVGALAGRSVFATLAQYFGTKPSPTHPTKPVRAVWGVHDIGKLLGIDKTKVEEFFKRVDCRFGASDSEIFDEQRRQATAWEHWRILHELGFFKIYFP